MLYHQFEDLVHDRSTVKVQQLKMLAQSLVCFLLRFHAPRRHVRGFLMPDGFRGIQSGRDRQLYVHAVMEVFKDEPLYCNVCDKLFVQVLKYYTLVPISHC